jgi:iron complex outermembrane receptor protein
MAFSRALASSASLFAIAATAFAAPALAQDQGEETQQAASGAGDETIVITGTRLARDPNAVAPSPIVTVDIADLRATGQTDISEALREVPALLSSGTIEDSIERGAGGIGQATLNLRGLGANRTLVLVNGRRHVSGVAGSQTVDIATIPRALIQTVDVLTGGASSIYGADAVTGVVNFNLRPDYDGIEVSMQAGISSQGDGRTFGIDAVYGRNFAEGRGNITLAGSYSRGEELTFGQREFSRDNFQASAGLTYPHPDRRFQQGDISAASTPNFFQRFSIAQGRYPYGFAIPTPAQFATFFPGVTPTPAEQALMDRALNSPSNILGRQPTFAISSASGSIARADFDYFNLDVDNNGVPDCFDSFVGFIFAQCYISLPGGGVRPFRDGLISSSTNQLGGDGIPESSDFQSLIPQTERYDINLLANYEFSSSARAFAELKYVRTNTASTPINVNGFYDLLYIAPDNPFIPAVLQADADDAGGLLVSRDFEDLASRSRSTRETYRAVLGMRGEITPNLAYQVYGNYGRSENETTGQSVLPDRLFAAIDAVQGPNGPVCASNLDPTRIHPGSEFFPVITPGFFTFTPGANSGCLPINMFNGPIAVSPEAAAWIAPDTTTRSVIDQLVFAAEFTGNTGAFLNLPGGAIQFAFGAEYRRERSRTEFDPLVLGLLPSGSPAGPAGSFVGDIDPDKQSLTFDTATRTLNTSGEFDVIEAFAEIRIPILRDVPFAHELTLEGAARYSDYSTIGGAFTWNVNGTWAPVRDIRFRGTYAVAIRAPNITELFSPQQGTVFRPIDPCNTSAIAALLASSDPENVARGQRRQNNCAADGAPAGYEDPLTARFSGTTGGNPDLQEETATTWTVGTVIQPRWIPGLTISADYYNIEIKDAISAVSAQNIVNSCYEAESFPNQFCDLFERNRTVGSPTFFGFTFLRQTQLNFGRFETSGIDASINYNFSLGQHRFSLRATGNWTEKVNQFFDPTNPNVVDPELGELGFPEWSGSASVSWTRGPFTLGYRLQYIGEQALAGVEIERQDVEFGPAGTGPDYFIHDLNFNIDVNDRFTFYGGINNLTNEAPFSNRVSFPVSPLGRVFFVGARARF